LLNGRDGFSNRMKKIVFTVVYALARVFDLSCMVTSSVLLMNRSLGPPSRFYKDSHLHPERRPISFCTSSLDRLLGFCIMHSAKYQVLAVPENNEKPIFKASTLWTHRAEIECSLTTSGWGGAELFLDSHFSFPPKIVKRKSTVSFGACYLVDPSSGQR
jgi:hypothetical protein